MRGRRLHLIITPFLQSLNRQKRSIRTMLKKKRELSLSRKIGWIKRLISSIKIWTSLRKITMRKSRILTKVFPSSRQPKRKRMIAKSVWTTSKASYSWLKWCWKRSRTKGRSTKRRLKNIKPSSRKETLSERRTMNLQQNSQSKERKLIASIQTFPHLRTK